MDVPITVAVISASAAVVVPALSFYFAKRKDRQAEWQRYKFELYRELVQAISGIAGTDSTPEGRRRFALACNTIHLIATSGVISALHDYQNETRTSNPRPDTDKHDQLLSRLFWEIRQDLGIPHNPDIARFKARLWCSPDGNIPASTDFSSDPSSRSGSIPSRLLHKEGTLYVAECPEVGTISQGKSVEEAVANLKEATELYVEEFPARKDRTS